MRPSSAAAEGEEGVTLFHGTDVGSAADIAEHGFDLENAVALGGGDAVWTTTSLADARWFAASNPAGGEPAVVGITVPKSLIEGLSSAELLEIDGPVHRFEPDAVDHLNAEARTWIVS